MGEDPKLLYYVRRIHQCRLGSKGQFWRLQKGCFRYLICNAHLRLNLRGWRGTIGIGILDGGPNLPICVHNLRHL